MPGTIALIPAKGYSERLPGKNFRAMAGRPMIDWTIRAAVDARGLFDDIVVSTDSENIFRHVKENWKEVSLIWRDIRSYEHEQRNLEKGTPGCPYLIGRQRCDCNGYWHEYLALYQPELTYFLQPTSPLREACDLKKANHVWEWAEVDYVFSVRETQDYPEWFVHVEDDDGILYAKPYNREASRKPSQLLPPKPYTPNGSVFIIGEDLAPYWGTLFPQKAAVFTMPLERSIDVDTEFDFTVAEALLIARQRNADPVKALKELMAGPLGDLNQTARLLGCSKQTVRNWLSGASNPDTTTGRFLLMLRELYNEGRDIILYLEAFKWQNQERKN